MSAIDPWWKKISNSLEDINRLYGKVTSLVEPRDVDETFSVEYKIAPCVDLVIQEPVSVEFRVSPQFPTIDPLIIVMNPTVFEDHGIAVNGAQLRIPWMDDTKYPLTVWVFAIRNLFLGSNVPPWATPVPMRSKFIIEQVCSVSTTVIAGSGAIRGKRAYMEDFDFSFPSVNILDRFNVAMFGVLDGHGGQECARFVADELPTNIISCLRSGNNCAESLFRAYLKTDEDFLNDANCKAGCTATVMLFDHANGVVCVANTGDTRAVVSRLATAVDITRDMKATDPIEVARIAKGGGYVANGRVLGSLAIARALGDKNLKDSPSTSLIADPEVTSFSVTADDEFIVMATDGLWDVMSSQDVVDMIHNLLAERNAFAGYKSATDNAADDRELHRIADVLANHACNELNSSDNITVMIIMLAHRPVVGGSVVSRHTYGVSTAETTHASSFSTGVEHGRSSSSSMKQYEETHAKLSGGAVVGSSTGSMADDELMEFLLDDSNF